MAGPRPSNSVNLDISGGAITAVLGPNGSGKSTLLKIMSTCLEADNGTVTFSMASIREEKGGRPRSFHCSAHCGVDMTGLENARFFSSVYGMEEGQALQSISSLFGFDGSSGCPEQASVHLFLGDEKEVGGGRGPGPRSEVRHNGRTDDGNGFCVKNISYSILRGFPGEGQPW